MVKHLPSWCKIAYVLLLHRSTMHQKSLESMTYARLEVTFTWRKCFSSKEMSPSPSHYITRFHFHSVSLARVFEY